MHRLFPLLTAAAALAPATPAGADDYVASLARDTPIAAYGGALAWSDYDTATNRYRLVVAARGAAPAAAPIPPARRAFDVSLGPDPANRPVALYTRCTRAAGTRGCDVYRYDVAMRRERRLGFSSPREDEAWPAQWGIRVAFVRRHRTGGVGAALDCDVPFVKTVNVPRPARRLHRGTCGRTTGMSIHRERIVQVTLGSPPGATGFDSQVRRLSTRGGAVKVLARQGTGEESDAFASPSQSVWSVWVTRSGLNPRPAFVRIDARTGRQREVPALTRLTGPLARDERGHLYYVEGSASGGESCLALGLAPCRLVHTAVDPFSSRQRALLPTLTIGGPGSNDRRATTFGDPFLLTGRLYRTIVSAGRVVRLDPLAGVPIELLEVGSEPIGGAETARPTGILVATGADGRWAYTVPYPGPRPWFSAVTGAPYQLPTHAGRGTSTAVEAQITLAVSAATFAGTVAPGQPGRSVHIQRLQSRDCELAVNGGQPSCRDTWATVASTPLAGAGTTFSTTIPAPPPGTYRAAILAADAQSDPAAYPGASVETPVGDSACPDGDDCG